MGAGAAGHRGRGWAEVGGWGNGVGGGGMGTEGVMGDKRT